jgi:hypothetical protein
VRLLAALLLMLAVPGGTAAAEGRVVFFGFEWINTSLEPTRPNEEARLAAIGGQLGDALTTRGFTLVDPAPVAEKAASVDLRSCPACELDLAQELDAEFAVLGWVQKVSNLILNINLQIHEVATGRLVGAGSVDIRGNTDETWRRGTRRLIERTLPAPLGTERPIDKPE